MSTSLYEASKLYLSNQATGNGNIVNIGNIRSITIILIPMFEVTRWIGDSRQPRLRFKPKPKLQGWIIMDNVSIYGQIRQCKACHYKWIRKWLKRVDRS